MATLSGRQSAFAATRHDGLADFSALKCPIIHKTSSPQLIGLEQRRAMEYGFTSSSLVL